MKRAVLAGALLPALLIFLLFGYRDVGGQAIDIRSELKTEPAQGHAAPGIRVEGKNLLISAPITLPDPCHKVTHRIKAEGTTIVVTLQIENPPPDSFCIQVLQTVLARVTLFDLPSGTYALTLKTPQSTQRETVRVD